MGTETAYLSIDIMLHCLSYYFFKYPKIPLCPLPMKSLGPPEGPPPGFNLGFLLFLDLLLRKRSGVLRQ